jgi:tRNA (guanine-N7-)-methyltransferase
MTPGGDRTGQANPDGPAGSGSRPEAGHPERTRRILYGRRVGRPLGDGRKRLLDELLPRLALDLTGAAPGATDPKTWFFPATPPPFSEGPAQAVRAVWLEVGFGGGEHLCAQAASHPDIGLIGCEPFLNGVASALKQIARDRLNNIRLHADDARQVIETLAPASLDRVFVLFPDPWPKSRHAKRRFISPAALDALARVMAPGAQLRVASDDPGYIRWALGQLLAHPGFAWTAARADDWRSRPADQPPTRYEEKARAKGISPVFLVFRRL